MVVSTTVDSDARGIPQVAQLQLLGRLGTIGCARILEALLQEDDVSATQLAADTGLSCDQLSDVLECLRWCRLITPRNDGRHTHYRLADAQVREMLTLMRAIVSTRVAELSNCVGPFRGIDDPSAP